ncbi:hypothetical protein BDF14DRAFT_1725252 [Spinellus fusiger]|nr:hypothetical protein BDF14DRAFT_1725252 [Spinellus fusiger]
MKTATNNPPGTFPRTAPKTSSRTSVKTSSKTFSRSSVHFDDPFAAVTHDPENNSHWEDRSSAVLSTTAESPYTTREEQDDITTDVLYRHYKPTPEETHLTVFDAMVQEQARKNSIASLRLTRTLSRSYTMYGDYEKVAYFFPCFSTLRFEVYCPTSTPPVERVHQLLTDQGKSLLERILNAQGWWLDVLSPTEEEMHVLNKTFRIHPLTAEDIQAQEPREKVELFPHYTFVCFRSFDTDVGGEILHPYNFYILIFKSGILTFHFKSSPHTEHVRQRIEQLKEYTTITPDWISYALMDSITDGFAPTISEVEIEAIALDELSLVLHRSEQADMLKRISHCRRRSTQLSRLLSSKLDVLKSLMKRYEDKTRDPLFFDLYCLQAEEDTQDGEMSLSKKAFSEVLLYLGDVQDHVVTMVQNINHYDRGLSRAHTNYLAQVNLELSETYAKTNGVMNRLSFMASILVPVTIIGGLWGMNIHVPGQDSVDLIYFYWILTGMVVYVICTTYFGKQMHIL